MIEFLLKNALSIVQSLGIIGGLLFAGLNFRREGKAKRAANYVTLVQNYRDVWKLRISNPELMRVLDNTIDVTKEKISDAEAQFVSFLLFHLTTYFQLRKNGQIDKIEAIGDDIRKFFNAPLVKKFWEENKRFYNSDFVEFVEKYTRS